MKITILSLFENFFNEFINTSIIKKAIDNQLVEIEIINFRNFSKDKHQKVDDTPYGGGAGMVLTLQPIVDAINYCKTAQSKVILLTPSGKSYNQAVAHQLKTNNHLIIVCGHYEGFDERILNYVDYQISIGDYILTGGEVAAMVVIDSIVRLIPNVISNLSLECESFENSLLDFPNYTKPYDFNGYRVPEILLSGKHKEISKIRKEWQINKTKNNRKDLFKKYLEENEGGSYECRKND